VHEAFSLGTTGEDDGAGVMGIDSGDADSIAAPDCEGANAGATCVKSGAAPRLVGVTETGSA
jgi:hypothetical protein